MKKLIIILTVVTVSLSGCLKDKPNVDFSKVFPTINLPYSGLAYYSQDAVTDAGDTITKSFTINLASDYPLTKDTKVTVGVNNALIATYNAANSGVTFLAMPDGSYTFPTTTVTIKAGTRLATLSVTFIKHFLDPSLSYMLPISILSADQVISSNFSTHYYHFIGNDFAGVYKQNFQRYNAADSTSVGLSGASFTNHAAIFSPVSPTEFTVATGYAGGVYVYDVTFKKSVVGGVAMYSNFAVSFTATSITAGTGSGITLTQPPVFLNPPFSVAGPLTFAQALQIFHFQFKAHTSADRYLIDTFYK